ncbi:MAG: hypothetical protein M3071_17955 [Actinomycetota bacterium]|nr:hypothetical protein [Actinomycetota bacterium]
MRAAILREHGQTRSSATSPIPFPPRASEVVAAGLNPVDISVASGSFYAGAPPLPCVMGREGVGRTPEGELAHFDGPVPLYGSFAQRALVYAESLIPARDRARGGRGARRGRSRARAGTGGARGG